MCDGSIPIVDLRDFFSESRKKSFIEGVGSALENIGFFALKNHTIGEDFLDKMYLSADSFFSLSNSAKNPMRDLK